MLGVAVEGVRGGLARTTEISIINNARGGCAYLAPPLDFLSLCSLRSFRLCLSSSEEEDEDDDDELEDETLRRRACGSMMMGAKLPLLHQSAIIIFVTYR